MSLAITTTRAGAAALGAEAAADAPVTVTNADSLRFERAMLDPAVARAGDVEAVRRATAGDAAAVRGAVATTATKAASAVTAADDIPAATAGVIRVSSGAELARALEDVRPGQHIVLASGTYRAPGGAFEVRTSGTREAPVVIRAEDPLGARMESAVRLLGSDQIVSGLAFATGGRAVEIAGDRSRLTRSRITGGDEIAVLVRAGVDTRVDHNELVGLAGRGISIDPDATRPGALLRPRIDHNWLHDWVGRPDTNVHEPIQIGQSWSDRTVSVGAVVEYNLLERVGVDPEAVSIKSSDNVVRFNTLLDSEAAFVNRYGMNNRIEANWLEGSRGIRVRDEGTIVAGNRIIDSQGAGLRVLAGNTTADQTSRDRPYAAAKGTLLIGNDVERTIIGDAFSGSRFEATGTRIESHRGDVAVTHLAAGVTRSDAATTTARSASGAVRLAASDVGPGGTFTGEPWPTAAVGGDTPGSRILASVDRVRVSYIGPEEADPGDISLAEARREMAAALAVLGFGLNRVELSNEP